ncbi:hypothetical protein PR048_001602 [Dryococelus australis]|uniref:Uncharacterized protein n=1 Tax=Dryococelus australis TaxID=614101 RepID=A0ABQ9IKA0_9NEOP|nr:hypothetical protein PR048_001602 [Dryococelus australis]
MPANTGAFNSVHHDTLLQKLFYLGIFRVIDVQLHMVCMLAFLKYLSRARSYMHYLHLMSSSLWEL